MEDERVKQLAETLRKHGLAASVYEATEKAKSILNVRTQRSDASQENDRLFSGREMKNEQILPKFDLDVGNENTTLNELLREINVLQSSIFKT